jgi:phosphatidylglycerophosphatase A
MSIVRPDGRFLLAHPAHFIALGFGSGLAPFAPGTFGTLVAIPIALALRAYTNDVVFIAAIVLLFAVGAWAAQVTGRDLGVADHGSIVIDEIAAFLLVLFFVGSGVLQQAVAFLLFRVFDIVKPPPIRQVDAAFKNGLGVMADDALAALYALLVIALGHRIIEG